jgi:carbon storage regulator
MLVLTRKTGQKLIIANDIEITILETKGESVKLGINAPKNISVYREEIFEEIRKANQQAVPAAQGDALDQALQLLDRKPGLPKPPGAS